MGSDGAGDGDACIAAWRPVVAAEGLFSFLGCPDLERKGMVGEAKSGALRGAVLAATVAIAGGGLRWVPLVEQPSFTPCPSEADLSFAFPSRNPAAAL